MLIQVLYCIISYDNYLQFRALGGFSVKLLTFQERFLKPAHDKMQRFERARWKECNLQFSVGFTLPE